MTSVSKQAQKHIIEVYETTYHLHSMLRLLHQFYLMAAGDFYLEFISRVDYGLLHSPAEISDGWLQDEFNHCVHRTSLSASYQFISQHVRLRRVRALTALDMWRQPFFSIECEPNLNVLFSPAVMSKYELVFTTLMSLKTQSLGMERLWMEHCSLGQELDAMKNQEIKKTLRPAMDRFNLLRVKIQSFLVTLQNFYFLHVIDKLFDNLLSKLQSVDRFDSILKLHEQYMDDLCRFFFISNGDVGMKQSITDLLDCSKRFVGLHVII